MKHLRLFIIPVLITAFFFSGCKKNMVDDQYTPIINPVIPDFTTQINAAVNGFITDENGEAVEGVSITGGAITVATDEFGYFKINNAAFAKSAGFVQVSKAGYFTGYRTFLPVQGKETFIRLQLIPKTTTGTIESMAGGTVSIAGGATVSLPANAVVIASNNNPYSGTVNVFAHLLDPSDMPTTSLTMPGDLTGVDSAGHLNVLQTFGMLAVELTSNSGELLQIAPGKKAALHFPIPSSLQAAAPLYIPLWYFDETKGVWEQEGHAIKNGNSYDGEVSHFSYWNCDIGLPLVNFTAQIIDLSLNKIANVPVTLTMTNTPNISRTAYTDTNGVVYGLVPANTSLKIEVMAPCNQAVTVQTITTSNQPVDMGAIQVNFEQMAASIEGTVINCNGNPVTNGYIIMASLGNNSIINVTNGTFSAAGKVCPGTNLVLTAFDRETSYQSDALNATINQGSNNVGELATCGTSGTEIINIDRGLPPSIVYTLPQYMFGGNFYFLNDSTSINAIDLLNSNQLVFKLDFKGGATPGIHQLANNRLVTINSLDWVFEAGTTVNISSYGLIGQFITGTLNGNATMLAQPITRTYNIEFSIKRDQ